jgi:hypothetical protein
MFNIFMLENSDLNYLIHSFVIWKSKNLKLDHAWIDYVSIL